jgi:drug/metabolite transporter (DMT)-like permease
MSVGGSLLFFVFQPWKYTPNIDIETVAAMFAIIFFGTIIAFTFYMVGVKLIGATHASLYACIEPVVAMVLASVWLGAPFTFIDMIGFLFIISTIFVLTLAGKEKVSTGEQRA